MIPFIKTYLSHSRPLSGVGQRQKTAGEQGRAGGAEGSAADGSRKSRLFTISEEKIAKALEYFRTNFTQNGQGRPLYGSRKGLIFDVRI